MDSRPSPSGGSWLSALDSPHSDLPASHSRTSRYRPVSFEPAVTDGAHPQELDAPTSRLPLILHCMSCSRTSTWYHPVHQNFEQPPHLDVPPPLSISSHSTSSEPSSIGTDLFSGIAMSPLTDSPCSEPVSTNLEAQLLSPDDKTSVALSLKSAVSRQGSVPLQSWIGGGLRGTCSSCYVLNSNGVPRETRTQALLQPRSNRSKVTASEPGSDKSIPLLSVSDLHRRPPHTLTQTIASEDLQFVRSASQQSSAGAAPLLLPSLPPVTPDKRSPRLPQAIKSGVLHSSPDLMKSVAVSLPSLPSTVNSKRPIVTCGRDLISELPPKFNLPEAESIKFALPARSRKKSPSKPSHNAQVTDMPVEVINKHEEAPVDATRHEVTHRGTSLRTLLREAKIPQSDSADLSHSGRRHPTAVDMWQAAMIATPRDHLRQGDFTTWQPYGRIDTPFYQLINGLSASTSSLSAKETLSTSITSFRDPSVCGDSRPCSPVSDKPMESEPVLLRRRSTIGRPATADTLTNRPSWEFSTNAGRYLSVLPHNESQEVLSGPALEKPPRNPSSNMSLMARLTNLQSSATKATKGYKRRPNTATGSTQSSSIVQSSPKPSQGCSSTPSPNTSGPSTLMPSLSLAGAKGMSTGSRITNVDRFKRPATATCSGTRTELNSSNKEFITARSIPIQRPTTGKTGPTYVPTLPPIQGRSERTGMADSADDQQKRFLLPRELDIRPQESFSVGSSNSAQISPTSVSSQSQSRQTPPVQFSQSVPNFLLKTRFPTPKRNAFYAAAALAVTSDQLTDSDMKQSNVDSCPWLQPEDFQSKSRNFTLSILPRPTASTFSPGQKISVHLKLSNKTKVRKYTSIYLMLIGNTSSESAPQANVHTFLRHTYLIHPNPSEEVRVASHSGDLCEWNVDLNIPDYANCTCTPGPLPVPSTGTHASGQVSYSFQLHADRKQLLSNQESLSIPLNVITRSEARYQVTTQLLRTASRKGRIPFAGGYLGSIDELIFSHQVYYQSADRLRIGYQFELQLSPNSFLPPSVAEEVSKATKVQIHTLMRVHPDECALKFADHRSKIQIVPPGNQGNCAKWIVKGFLELKSVSQQMKAIRIPIESTPRTPRRPENTTGSRNMLSSSHGNNSLINNSLINGVSSPLSSSVNHSLQQETERQAKINSSQLFLIATIDHCPGVFTKPVEISSLIGPELLSPCSLRKFGDEMMKKAVMAEKMKRVQEENSKNDL